MNPSWWSQPFRPEGDTASEGIRRQLGIPDLDPLTVLVREAAQNSWDARSGNGPVHFGISIRTVVGETADAWRRHLLPGPELGGVDLQQSLGDGDFRILVVSDRGTTGLGGATRSDVVSDEPPDFVNFVRNVGEARDTERGGGTYGFGKGIFYRLSKPHVMLTYTQCIHHGAPTRRLIAAALGSSFDDDGFRFTGRHWWGLVQGGVPDPIEDSAAKRIALELGLPEFDDGDLGTTIVVVDPDLGTEIEGEMDLDRDASTAAGVIRSSMLWYLWPKLIDRGAGIPLKVSVEVDGADLPIPSPTSTSELRPFTQALTALDSGQGQAHRRTADGLTTGWFSGAVIPADMPASPALALASPIAGLLHHCARMRSVELVVDYLAGPPPPDDITQYAAVFRATPEADEHFSDAEPPTHDSWVTRGLSGTTMGVVQGAQKFVRTRMAEVVAPLLDPRDAELVPLGRISARLARMLPGMSGNAAGGSGGGTRSGGGGGGPASWQFVGTPALRIVEGAPRVVGSIRVDSTPTRLVAAAEVVVDGGREAVGPADSEGPMILGWRSSGGRTVEGALLIVDDGDDAEWEVHASAPSDAVTRLSVRTAKAGESNA